MLTLKGPSSRPRATLSPGTMNRNRTYGSKGQPKIFEISRCSQGAHIAARDLFSTTPPAWLAALPIQKSPFGEIRINPPGSNS
jgi:hypothetical protein